MALNTLICIIVRGGIATCVVYFALTERRKDLKVFAISV